MPRGSRPGERRGGRKPGTPNKKTLIKNAVFLAAAAEPNRSPLDFMLALMRDPQVPLDDRIELAAKAAPFVHARPEPIRKKRTDPLDLRDRLGESGDLKFGKVEAKPDPAKAAVNGDAGQGADAGGGENGDPGGGQGLSPVDFLLGVMNDSTADPEQRVKAAAVAARYKHPYAGESDVPTVSVVEDKFGFKVDPELARAERDDRLREARLRATSHLRKKDSVEAKAAEQELEQIGKRRAERLALVKFPDGYTYSDREADKRRLGEFYSKRLSRKKLTPEEDAEEAHLEVRVLHPEAKPPAIAPGKYEMKWPMTRMVELEERVLAGDTTAADEEELKHLRSSHPEVAADVDRLDHHYNYHLRREKEIGKNAGLSWFDASDAAKIKCEPLRDPRKMLDLEELREGPRKRIYALEVLRFDKRITREETKELEDWHRRYPQRAERTRNFVVRRLSDDERQRGYARQYGQDPGPIEEDKWPRVRTRRFGLPEG
jgi:hypothetical protein